MLNSIEVKLLISIIEACKIATQERNEHYIGVITDIGHSYVIDTISENGETPDMPSCMVNKKSGKTSICFIPDYWEELQKGKNITIPKEYQYK